MTTTIIYEKMMPILKVFFSGKNKEIFIKSFMITLSLFFDLCFSQKRDKSLFILIYINKENAHMTYALFLLY